MTQSNPIHLPQLWIKHTSHTVLLNQTCPIQCDFCPLWKPDFKPQTTTPSLSGTLAQLKQSKRTRITQFFDRWIPGDWRPIVHLVGGDPMRSEDVLEWCKTLRTHGFQIWIWTTGLENRSDQDQLDRVVDQWMVYIPSLDPKTYLDIVGIDRLTYLKERLQNWAIASSKIMLNFPVRPTTIQELPDIHEFSNGLSLPLWIHYRIEEGFSSDSLAYIHRYHRIKNVEIWKITGRYLDRCQAIVPF